MIFLVVLLTVSLLLANKLNKQKYLEFLGQVDIKQNKLKGFMPFVLAIFDSSKYRYNLSVDNQLIGKLAELKSVRKDVNLIKIHRVNQLATAVFALLIVSILGMFNEISNWQAKGFYSLDTDYLVFAGIVFGIMIFVVEDEVNKKVKKRRQDIRIEFPNFINKLALLINAGMTVPRAWEKIVSDSKKENALYDELWIVVKEIRGGVSESKAYEDFAKRCRVPEITKFVAAVIQNLRKGNSEMVSVLRLQAIESWNTRKTLAKKIGEEASTKLLLPMMIMFVGILMVVIAPAILQLNI